jgi:hypothetical protein
MFLLRHLCRIDILAFIRDDRPVEMLDGRRRTLAIIVLSVALFSLLAFVYMAQSARMIRRQRNIRRAWSF